MRFLNLFIALLTLLVRAGLWLVCYTSRWNEERPQSEDTAEGGRHGDQDGATRALCTDKSGIQTACDGSIGCAFDDGAAVRKERQFVGLAPEFQHKVVVPDLSVRLQAERHFAEVHRALSLVNLDRIASA